MVLYYNKLFVSEEDPSLLKVINEAINHYKGLKWINKPDMGQLKTYQSLLKECETSTFIRSLKLARDTYYAHYDKKRPLKIPFESDDLGKYLATAQEIINYLLLHFENRQYHFSFSIIDVGHNMIYDLFKFRQIKMALIHSKFTFDKELSIDQIREIMK
jgi:hypothetical protein